MPIFLITVISKNKSSLINFLFFLFNNLKINLINCCIKKELQKTIITVLKSPHVNKKAQDQFESRVFSKQFLLVSHNILKYLIILRIIKIKLFPDILFKIKIFIANKNSYKIKSKIINPTKYTVNIYKFNNLTQKMSFINFKTKKINSKLVKKSKNYFKILDCYGEVCFQV